MPGRSHHHHHHHHDYHRIWLERNARLIFVALFAIAAGALVVVAVHGAPHASAHHVVAGPLPTFNSQAAPALTFAAVGDSVTAGNSPDIATGRPGTLSWAYWARDATLRFVGGWAHGGATTAAMAENVTPFKADVLVILAGTNDSGQKIPFAESATNYDKIVAESGITRVVVSSIPPRDTTPGIPGPYNDQLKTLAEARGWTYVDAAAAVRNGDHYIDGFTTDGVHPTPEAAKALGLAIRAAILPTTP